MTCTIQVRVDDDLKEKSDSLFKELGTDTTTAIRMFLTQAIEYNGFPFEIKKERKNPYRSFTEEELLESLAIARAQAESGDYMSGKDSVKQLRRKYGL